MKEILNVIHNTIYQFFDVCDDEEASMSDKDKLLLEVNKAICNNLKALDQQPCEGMRDATEEERKSTKDYINSISKPTGLQFDDIYEELDFVRPHKKISVNLQPCEDCISREAVVNWLEVCTDDSIEHAIESNLEFIPSVTPQPKTGRWIYDGDCIICNKCLKAFGWISMNMASDFCPNCGADMRGEEDE